MSHYSQRDQLQFLASALKRVQQIRRALCAVALFRLQQPFFAEAVADAQHVVGIGEQSHAIINV